ncbi:MAG TPA: hypothetical protein VGN26_16745 [Armatimonadota bacterium]|jgi:hypothetical protein
MLKRLSITVASCLLLLGGVGIGYAEVPAPPLLVGDLDHSGKADVKDVILALRIATGIAEPTQDNLAVGDLSPLVGVNGRDMGDGQIGVADVLAIMKLVLGLQTTDAYAYTGALNAGAEVDGKTIGEWGKEWSLWFYGMGAAPTGPKFMESLGSNKDTGQAKGTFDEVTQAGSPLVLAVAGGIHPNPDMLAEYLNSLQVELYVDGRPVVNPKNYIAGPSLVDLGEYGAAYVEQIVLGFRFSKGNHVVWRFSHSPEWGDIDATYNIVAQ